MLEGCRAAADVPASDEERHASHERQRLASDALADDEEKREHGDVHDPGRCAGLPGPEHPEEIEGYGEFSGNAEMVGVPQKLIVGPVEHWSDPRIKKRSDRSANDQDDWLLLEGGQDVRPVIVPHVGAARVAEVGFPEECAADCLREPADSREADDDRDDDPCKQIDFCPSARKAMIHGVSDGKEGAGEDAEQGGAATGNHEHDRE